MQLKWLCCLPLLALCGCPDNRNPQPPADGLPDGGPGGVQPAEPAEAMPNNEDVALAAGVLLSCIEQPEGTPADQAVPLSTVWLAAARLDLAAPLDATLSLARAALLRQIEKGGGQPLPQLSAAWLACEPDKARRFIAGQLEQGNAAYVPALSYRRETGHSVLAGLDGSRMNSSTATIVLNVLRQWGAPEAADLQLYRGLAQNEHLPTRLRAIGCLIALGQADAAQLSQLTDSLEQANLENLGAACEAVRTAGIAKAEQCGALADALVPLAAKCAMGDENAEARQEAIPLYAAYAAAYLPVEQARLIRTRMLGATVPAVRWQARLGELLQGDASFWNTAIEQQGVDKQDLWIALQVPEAVHPALLATYQLAARSDSENIRVQAARQLNRYSAFTSDDSVTGVLERLRGDSAVQVREAAWYTCAALELPGLTQKALSAAGDSAQHPAVRLAAALYVLRRAETLRPAAGGSQATIGRRSDTGDSSPEADN